MGCTFLFLGLQSRKHLYFHTLKNNIMTGSSLCSLLGNDKTFTSMIKCLPQHQEIACAIRYDHEEQTTQAPYLGLI